MITTRHIDWVGTSENWPRAESNVDAPLKMALVEEVVLDVAAGAGIHVSRKAAITCCSRLALRTALITTGLNPKWQPFYFVPGVVKAPASCKNQGVRFMPSTEYTEQLSRHCPELASFGVVEEYVIGTHWEQDGFIINGKLHFFRTLLQIWNDDFTKILCYSRENNAEILSATEVAVRQIGLDNCPFCFEFVQDRERIVLLDAHTRLGEDEGLAALMSDVYPLDVIEEAARRL